VPLVGDAHTINLVEPKKLSRAIANLVYMADPVGNLATDQIVCGLTCIFWLTGSNNQVSLTTKEQGTQHPI